MGVCIRPSHRRLRRPSLLILLLAPLLDPWRRRCWVQSSRGFADRSVWRACRGGRRYASALSWRDCGRERPWSGKRRRACGVHRSCHPMNDTFTGGLTPETPLVGHDPVGTWPSDVLLRGRDVAVTAVATPAYSTVAKRRGRHLQTTLIRRIIGGKSSWGASSSHEAFHACKA